MVNEVAYRGNDIILIAYLIEFRTQESDGYHGHLELRGGIFQLYC